jgi:hypothetical protein
VAYTEKRYCPLCRWQTTFICQSSGCFCPKCGYEEPLDQQARDLLEETERQVEETVSNKRSEEFSGA